MCRLLVGLCFRSGCGSMDSQSSGAIQWRESVRNMLESTAHPFTHTFRKFVTDQDVYIERQCK